jgi:hypothetical protein
MSTQIIKSTSESTTPKATKTQIIEALVQKEIEQRIAHNKAMEERRKKIDKKIHEIAIANLVNKKEEELSSCRSSVWGKAIRIELEFSSDETDKLLAERGNLGRNKSLMYSDVKKEITALVNTQTNVKENPLLRPENNKSLEILLSVLKSPQQHNLEIK